MLLSSYSNKLVSDSIYAIIIYKDRLILVNKEKKLRYACYSFSRIKSNI